MSTPWQEVQHALNEKRCELVISGPSYSERIDSYGIDPNLFKITSLNFLEISETVLKSLPDSFGSLSNLTRLLVSYNELQLLPDSVGELKKLKFLDISHNKITDLPPTISALTELQTINVSSNKLGSLPDLSNLIKLVSLNLCHNTFTTFPVSVCDPKLIHFTDLIANNNQISDIPVEIGNLSALRVLDLGVNAIENVPGELGGCNKIKEVNLKGNKLKDRRLMKLVEQCHPKQVMEYVRSHCPKANNDGEKQGKSKKKSKQRKKSESEEVSELMDEMKILHVSDDTVKIILCEKVVDVRPYIICCKVLDVNLSDDKLFKKFISLQTKLHDTICEKRNVATIATHDFSKIEGNLFYDAKPPEAIMIHPLNKKKKVSAAALYLHLNDEADAMRKEKKKNTYSGIHKYLYLLKDKPLYPCLLDSADTVISFPPITNSENTKISPETKSMLLEVTGNNMNSCKKIMDTLLTEILKLGIGNTNVGEANGEDDSPNKNILVVEQVKVVDEEGKLKVVYPSRTDIQAEGISIKRE